LVVVNADSNGSRLSSQRGIASFVGFESRVAYRLAHGPDREAFCYCPQLPVRGMVADMDAKDVPALTADALNSLERRVGDDIAELKHDVAGLKHDVHLLNVKVEVNQQTTEEKLDRGFRQVLEHLEKR